MKKKPAQDALKSLVFEIGCEELPATNLADIFESAAAEKTENALKVKWKKTFEDHRIAFRCAEVWATPRRLVFYLDGVAASQTPRDQLTKLMTQAEAYPDGKPGEKFLTILKHRNASVSETVVEDLNGKPHVFIKKAEPVQKTATVLPAILEAFVPSLSFPKNMKWDESGLYFPRPIRSTLCFYGSECVRFKIGGTRSGDKTYFFSRGRRSAATVTDAASYFRALKKESVCLDPEERKKTIQAVLDKLAKSFHGKLYDDPFLMSEVNFLVENPQGLAAPFNDEFLKLPLEVLTVSMARKQRIFGLVDKDGRVLPRFLAIADRPMSEKERKLISLNYENILHAKLQDSLFFYKEDSKTPLEKKREELKNLIFLKGAGSMLQKSERLEKMAAFSGLLPAGETQKLKRAAYLSKCDLLTQMVGEFPELQGVMGKYYSMEGGEDRQVAGAIGEQYLPRTVSDRLPESAPGAALSVLDKIDLICTCFALGLQPSSSMDPYALRRSASAVFKILVKRGLPADLSALVSENLQLLKAQIPGLDAEAVKKKLLPFFQDRFRAVLADMGLRPDIVDAVLASGFDDARAAYARAAALSQAGSQKDLLRAAKVIERTHNILKGNKENLPAKADPALFAEPLEHAVLAKFERHAPEVENAKQQGDFGRATSLYAEAFFDILNEFFDKVFINAEDLSVRKNRLSLLRSVKELYTRDIADLSRIQEKI